MGDGDTLIREGNRAGRRRDRFSIDPPALPTLDQPASWLNARGHVDRAACIEIGVAEARQLAGCVPHKTATRDLPWTRQMELIERARGTRDPSPRCNSNRSRLGGSMPVWKYRRLTEPNVRPLPGQKPAINGRGRVASGVIVIHARELDWLHRQRGPCKLAGDFRTSRAPAMRDRFMLRSKYPKHTFRFGVKHRGDDRVQRGEDRLLIDNPNKGATRTKKIGLASRWSQALRVEMWMFPRRIRPAYYFVCFGGCPPRACGGNAPSFREDTAHNRAVVAVVTQAARPKDFSHNPADVGVPAAALSTCRAGRKDPKSRQCPQRCLKLMMVQCTKEERRDARLVQCWIDCLPSAIRARADVRLTVAQLTARYGLIFEPRMLLCPRCLGAKYGNHPETVRQGWRRRRTT